MHLPAGVSTQPVDLPGDAVDSAYSRFLMEVRTAYYAARRESNPRIPNGNGDRPYPRYDGGVDTDGKRYQAVWPRVAQFLLDNDCDPHAFFMAQVITGKSNLMSPLSYCSDKALKRYR